MTPTQAKHIRLRILIVSALFLMFMGIICVRAVYVQIFRSPGLSQRAASEYEKSFEIQGKRGIIYDAKLQEMAISMEDKSIAAWPPRIRDIRETARQLSKVLGIPEKKLISKLSSHSSFVWIKRQAGRKASEEVKQLKLEGIGFIPEHNRFYPSGKAAAQVIGFIGIDGQGLEGLEFSFEKWLKGKTIQVTEYRDALGRGFAREAPAGAQLSTECSGNNLILTIDRTIQFIAEKALVEAVNTYDAKSGMAVVMEPKTGAILAIAHVPFFDPNNFRQFNPEIWRNRAVTDPFEPGSTMKIFSVASAVEYGGADLNSTFYCENGVYRIGKDVIRDTKPHGWLSLMKIIKYSSNIGSIKVSEMVGPEVLYKTLRDFGFGQKTGIECPGETTGSLSPPSQWSKVDTGAISYGYGISVSAVQLASAVSAIANKGVLMKPFVVQAITDWNGKTVKRFKPKKIRRVMSERTAELVTKMMTSVLEKSGTGYRAALNGYTACGKTGTAQRLDDFGEYTQTRYTASFVGFAPVEDPQIAIVVVVGEPKKQHYGGVVAAPVFRKIAQETLGYLNVQPVKAPRQLATVMRDRSSG